MHTHSGRRARFNYRKIGKVDISTLEFNFVSLFKQLKKKKKRKSPSPQECFWLPLKAPYLTVVVLPQFATKTPRSYSLTSFPLPSRMGRRIRRKKGKNSWDGMRRL